MFVLLFHKLLHLTRELCIMRQRRIEMSLGPTREAGDPYASSAWTASQTVIALEKLSLGLSAGESKHGDLGLDLSIDDEELDSFEIVSKEMKLLSKAKQI